IDDQFPDPPLKPPEGEDRELMYRLIKRATSMHLSTVKPYIYYKRIRGNMQLTDEDDEKYRSLQTNKELLEFHRKSSADEFTEEEIEVVQATLDDCFSELNELLKQDDFLVNGTFSLADIAWIPLHFTLDVLAGFDFSPYPNVADWTKRLSERDSYKTGVLQHWPEQLKRA
ncbi:MAG: glutathione S-transferase family protein, partial [Rhodothermales bacterium]|nr:glutathione S-transferase family protein [Rhodothermales bacterium]